MVSVAAVRSWQPAPPIALTAIIGSAMLYAFLPVLVRDLVDAGLSPVAIVFYRMLIPATVLVRYIDLSAKHRAATVWALGTGLVMGLGWIAHVHVVNVGAVGTAALTYMTYPLFTIATATVIFRRRPTIRAVVGGIIIVVAGVIGLGPASAGNWTPLVFVAPVTFGAAIAVLTERLHVLDGFARMAPVTVGATIGVAPLLVPLPTEAAIPDVSTVPTVVICGVACALVPMFLYGASAPTLGAAGSSLAGSAELPLTLVVAAVVLGEPAHHTQLLAAAMIGTAIWVASTEGHPPHELPPSVRQPAAPPPSADTANAELTSAPQPPHVPARG